jgi:hypothetical protein
VLYSSQEIFTDWLSRTGLSFKNADCDTKSWPHTKSSGYRDDEKIREGHEQLKAHFGT